MTEAGNCWMSSSDRLLLDFPPEKNVTIMRWIQLLHTKTWRSFKLFDEIWRFVYEKTEEQDQRAAEDPDHLLMELDSL